MNKPISRGNLILGIVLIMLGVFFLFARFFNFTFLDYLWPLIVVGVGLAFFVAMYTTGRSASGLAIPGSIITMIGLILFYHNLTDTWETWSYAWALIVVAVGVGSWIQGSYNKNPQAMKSGNHLIRIGLILFVAFGVFFELVIGISGERRGGILLAIFLILLGAFFLLRPQRFFATTAPKQDEFNVTEAPTETPKPPDDLPS